MAKIEASQDFKHHELDEVEARAYVAGETYEVSDRCAEVAVAEGWAKVVKPGKPKKADA